jgi:hypothetical protein
MTNKRVRGPRYVNRNCPNHEQAEHNRTNKTEEKIQVTWGSIKSHNICALEQKERE